MGFLAEAGDEAELWLSYHDKAGYDLTELCAEMHTFVASIYKLFVKRKVLETRDSYLGAALRFVAERRCFFLSRSGLGVTVAS